VTPIKPSKKNDATKANDEKGLGAKAPPALKNKDNIRSSREGKTPKNVTILG
jgi:hypothetical protein